MAGNLCRLCVNICHEYRNLFEDGCRTNAYEITVKYFDPMFLNAEEANHFTVMCLDCWRQVFDFHNFRQSVLLAQAKLLEDNKQAATVVKSPKEKCCDYVTPNNLMCDDIVVKEETDFILLPEKEVETEEIVYDVIVKEEVEFTPARPESAIEHSTVKCYPQMECTNIFVTDEEELTSLVKSTPKITFTKCLDNIKPNFMSLPDKEVIKTILDSKFSSDFTAEKSQSIHCDDGHFAGNLSVGSEQPRDISNEEVFCEDDELMDISEYELDSLDVHDSSDEDHMVSSNYRSTVNRMEEIDGKKKLSKDIAARRNVSKPKSVKRKREEELDDVIAQWRSHLECIICNDSYTSYTLLHEHFSQQHPSKECYIVCCDIKIKRRGHLAEHVRQHIDPNAFKCKFCSKRCTRRRNLNYHMLKQHGIDTNEDEIFVKGHSNNAGSSENIVTTTITESYCNSHKNDGNAAVIRACKESESKPHRKLALQENDDLIAQWFPMLECGVCKDSFPSFTLLHTHFRQNHPNGEGFVLCCLRKFSRRSKFQEHIRLHLDPKAFTCELCGKFYSNKYSLDYHMTLLHHNSNDNTSDGNVLQKNLPIRTQQKTKSNNKSNKRKKVQELDAIIAKWRPNLECVVCGETRPNFALLQEHFCKMHSEEACYITCCQLKFTGRHDIEEHIRLHNDPKAFMCEFCRKCFTSRRNLNRHERTKHRS